MKTGASKYEGLINTWFHSFSDKTKLVQINMQDIKHVSDIKHVLQWQQFS